jgi:hypothetical protein
MMYPNDDPVDPAIQVAGLAEDAKVYEIGDPVHPVEGYRVMTMAPPLKSIVPLFCPLEPRMQAGPGPLENVTAETQPPLQSDVVHVMKAEVDKTSFNIQHQNHYSVFVQVIVS